MYHKILKINKSKNFFKKNYNFLNSLLKRSNTTNSSEISIVKLNDSIKRLNATSSTNLLFQQQQTTQVNNNCIEPIKKIQKLSTTFNDKSANELLSKLYKLDPNNAQG